jgi:threonine dehydrogenase-like Zn-dependent dehydrogenase
MSERRSGSAGSDRADAGARRIRIARLIGPRRFDVVEQTLEPPGPGQVQVKILATGVCASELHAVIDDQPSYPLLIGHEPTAIVEEVGSGVDGFSPGMRVTGGFGPAFAERALADHRFLVAVPEGLGVEDGIGEPLGCVVEGRRRTRIIAGDRVAIVGVGYMGLLMLQLLPVGGTGAAVAIDPRPDARDTALGFGATEALSSTDVTSDLHGSFDVVVEATGTQLGLDLASELVREHGVVSILGYHVGARRTVDVQMWNWKAIDVVNAHVRRRDLLNEAIRRGLELTRQGKIQPGKLVSHRFGLGEVGNAFHALETKPEGFIKAVVFIE